jgi:hypothetical protein
MGYVGPYSGSGLCALYFGAQDSLATSTATPLCSHMVARTKAVGEALCGFLIPAFLGYARKPNFPILRARPICRQPLSVSVIQ